MRLPSCACLALFTAGCASGPIDLAGAKILDVRVFATSENVDVSKAEQLPCGTNELSVAVEVRAIPKGASKAQVFSSGGLKERVKANPADYKDFAITDPVGYEQGHSFDMRTIDFQVNEGFALDRVGEATSSGMYSSGSERLDVERVTLKVDRKKAIWSGFEVTATPKFAPEKKANKTWKPDLTCEKKTSEMAASGDLKHPRGDAGPTVAVYVTKANYKFGEVLLALIVSGSNARYVILDTAAPHTFVAAGGNGVEGTSVQPGGDGGSGGTIQVLVDDRYAALQNQLQFEAPGGKGGRGSPDGKAGSPGQGSVKSSNEVIGFLAKRKDLPTGVTLIDPPPPEKEKPGKPTPPKPTPPTKPPPAPVPPKPAPPPPAAPPKK